MMVDPRKTDARGQASNLLDTTQTDAGNEGDNGDAPPKRKEPTK